MTANYNGKFALLILTRDNYLEWRDRITLALDAENYLEVSEQNPPPEGDTDQNRTGAGRSGSELTQSDCDNDDFESREMNDDDEWDFENEDCNSENCEDDFESETEFDYASDYQFMPSEGGGAHHTDQTLPCDDWQKA
uniref:Uncharacterized protein n=1 Tax=Sphaerodactylus townsendi TaxID=933632 RepID=A0ACB8G1S0_9SAUR